MEHVKFLQCVRLVHFQPDRTIPPDDKFELLSYRMPTSVEPLVWAEAASESHKGSRVKCFVKVERPFERRRRRTTSGYMCRSRMIRIVRSSRFVSPSYERLI
jgi:hypothetical protein